MDFEDSDLDDHWSSDSDESKSGDSVAAAHDVSESTRSPSSGCGALFRSTVSCHLPYASQLPEEAAASWCRIRVQLARAYVLRDDGGLRLYLLRLESYLVLYGVCMSRVDYVRLVKLLLQCVLRSHTDYRNIETCCRLTQKLLKHSYRYVTRDDLVIEWRPLYDLYHSLNQHPFRGTSFTYCGSSTKRSLINLIRCCRSYFPVSATSQLLDQLLPELCPLDSNTTRVLHTLDIFLPTDLPPSLHCRGHQLWLPQLLDLFSVVANWEPWLQSLCSLMARLASHNIGHISQWQSGADSVQSGADSVLSAIFSWLLRSFALPMGYVRRSSHQPNSACIQPLTLWAVALMGGDRPALLYLERLLHAVGSYCYASNAGPWQDVLATFLHTLCRQFVARLNRERHRRATWNYNTTVGSRLSDSDVERFVRAVLPCTMQGIYWHSLSGKMKIQYCLVCLADLRADLVVDPIIDRLYESLQCVSEPQRVTCLTAALSSVLTSAVRLGTHNEQLFQLLQLLLPAVSVNDELKSSCVLQLLIVLFNSVTLVDCSQSAEHPSLTEEQRDACLLTAGLDSLLLQLLDRLLELVSSADREHTRQDHTPPPPPPSPSDCHSGGGMLGLAKAVMMGDREVSAALVLAVGLLKSDVTVQRQVGERLRRYWHECGALDTHSAGVMFSELCTALVSANTELAVKLLVVPVIDKIIDLAQQQQQQEGEGEQEREGMIGGGQIRRDDKPHRPLMFHLLLLRDMVVECGGGAVLLPLSAKLEQLLQLCLQLPQLPVTQLAASLFGAVLHSLLAVYVVSSGDWAARIADPQQRHLLVQEWGQCCDARRLRVQWHVAGDSELAWAGRLLSRFVVAQLLRIDQYTSDRPHMFSKEQLLCTLQLILAGLKGANTSLPSLKSPRSVDVGVVCVDTAPLAVETGCRQLSLELSCLRQRSADVMLTLLSYQLTHHADDTAVLTAIVSVIDAAVIGRPSANEFHATHSLRIAPQCLVGSRKFSELALTLRLAHHQKMRTVLAATLLPTTVLCDRVLPALLLLSTNVYTQVRKTAQYCLSRCLSLAFNSYRALYPRVVQLLRSDSLTHEQLKGVLYVVSWNGASSLLMLSWWPLALALWPTLVTCTDSEKPSIARLIDDIGRHTAHYTLAPLQYQFPSAGDSLAEQLCADITIIDTATTAGGATATGAAAAAAGGGAATGGATAAGGGATAAGGGATAATAAGGGVRVCLPDAEERHQAEQLMAAAASTSHQLYQQLLDQLLLLFNSGTLHWRRHQLALHLISMLIRADVPPSARLVETLLSGLVHSSIFIRKRCVALLLPLLKQLKCRHQLLLADTLADLDLPPAAAAAAATTGQHPCLQRLPPDGSGGGGVGRWRHWSQFGERTDNMWLQYNSAAAAAAAAAPPPTAAAAAAAASAADHTSCGGWLQQRFVHKMKWGYCGWSRPIVCVYRQLTEHPPDGATAAQQQLLAFIADSDRVARLVHYMSMEECKGRDTFLHSNARLFKALARNHGVKVLDALLPHMQKLSADLTESSQKLCSEIFAGVVRGSKHWPLVSVRHMWQCLMPLLLRCLAGVHKDTWHSWSLAISFCIGDRDPNRHYWLVETLMANTFCPEDSLFVTCTKLDLLASVMGEMEWRGAELAHRILELTASHLVNSYQNVRHGVGRLLCKVFSADFRGGPFTFGPRSAEFLHPHLDRLADLFSNKSQPDRLNSSAEVAVSSESVASSSPPSPMSPDSQTGAEGCGGSSSSGGGGGGVGVGGVEDERTAAHRLLQTVCSYVLASVRGRLLVYLTPEHMRLVPVLCTLQSANIDHHLQADCIQTLHALTVHQLDTETLAALLAQLRRVMAHGAWLGQMAALRLLQAVAFRNMFLLLQQQHMMNQVSELVLSALNCERTEVRQLASHVLSGLLHCHFIAPTAQRHLLAQFSSAAAAAVLPSVRNTAGATGPAASDYGACLRRRHAAVLGLCALVAAAPYHIPDHLPDTLSSLARHVTDPSPIQDTVRTTISNFRRTHHEDWSRHRQQFTEDQLSLLTDMAVSPSYFA